MQRFKDFILEKTIVADLHDGTVRIHVDPVAGIVVNTIRRSRDKLARGLLGLNKDGETYTLYVWDAYEAIHYDVEGHFDYEHDRFAYLGLYFCLNDHIPKDVANGTVVGKNNRHNIQARVMEGEDMSALSKCRAFRTIFG